MNKYMYVANVKIAIADNRTVHVGQYLLKQYTQHWTWKVNKLKSDNTKNNGWLMIFQGTARRRRR